MDVYQQVTDRIISLLERGTVPWRKPWSAGQGMPKNLVSKKEYRGVNTLLLGCQNYSSPYWVSYRQATEHFKGHIRKGEKSSICIFYKMLDKQCDENANAANNRIPMLRYYNLFNLEQCEGISAPPDPGDTVNPFTPIERAEQIIAGYKDRPEISYGGNIASYSPASDKIRMPNEYTFERSESFYQILWHEFGHSSGSKNRLARKEVMEVNRFGSDPYASEELVADLCSSFLCAHAGISNETVELSASYLAGWLSVLRQDKRMILSVSAKAQAAADYILGRHHTEEVSE